MTKLENRLPKCSLTLQQQEHLLELISLYGHFEDLDALADYFQTSRSTITGFLKRNDAVAAKSKGLFANRQAVRDYAARESILSEQFNPADLLDESIDWHVVDCQFPNHEEYIAQHPQLFSATKPKRKRLRRTSE